MPHRAFLVAHPLQKLTLRIRASLYRLRKKSQIGDLPWKSGPSGPRKAFRINAGFSPCARLSEANGLFRSLFSDAVSSSESQAPSGAGPSQTGFSANCSAAEARTLQHHEIRPPRRLARVERTLLSAAFDSCQEKTEWVEIESQWTARRREQAAMFPIVRKYPAA